MADRQRHAKKIDSVHWTGGAGQFIAQAGGTAGAALFPAQHLPETLLRIRGEWACSLNGGLANAAGAQVTIGIVQVPEGTATTVLWSPFTDSDAPWIWWDSFSLMYFEFVTDVNYSGITAAARRVIDSKAMRKLRNTEIQLVLENTTILTAASADVAFIGRGLAGS